MAKKPIAKPAKPDIALAQNMASILGWSQVIVFGHDGQETHVVTWGDTAEHSAQAAAGANAIKKSWGWPEDTIAESAKVKALKDRIAELEVIIGARKPEPKEAAYMVFVVAMTEHERGWGSKPDGYLAFRDEMEAKVFVHEQTKDRTGAAPDYYVSYDLVGYKPCSKRVFDGVRDSGKRFYFDHMPELAK